MQQQKTVSAILCFGAFFASTLCAMDQCAPSSAFLGKLQAAIRGGFNNGAAMVASEKKVSSVDAIAPVSLDKVMEKGIQEARTHVRFSRLSVPMYKASEEVALMVVEEAAVSFGKTMCRVGRCSTPDAEMAKVTLTHAMVEELASGKICF